MIESRYERIARLISQVRNAKFGQMVSYLEELISTGEWRDFTTPSETHFEFRACEFDYFLAVMEIDPDMVRQSYSRARDIDGLAAKRTRLADITGRGERPPHKEDRRDWKDVAGLYGERIERWAKADTAVVSDSVSRVARDPEKRREYEATGQLPSLKRRWHVDVRDENKAIARAIADKLLTDPGLAEEVFKIMRAHYDKKRRSGAINGSSGPDQNSTASMSANQGDGSA